MVYLVGYLYLIPQMEGVLNDFTNQHQICKVASLYPYHSMGHCLSKTRPYIQRQCTPTHCLCGAYQPQADSYDW